MITTVLAAALSINGLTAALDEVLSRDAFKGSIVGAYVGLEDGSLLYEREPALRMMPGSNQKLVSSAYALHRLGPELQPRTRFWKRGKRWIVDTDGNPTLTYAQLKGARERLGGKPEVVEVRQAYAPGFPPSWELDDLPNKYAAQVSALTVDRGSFELWAVNGKAVYLPASYGCSILRLKGGTLRVRFDPFRRHSTVSGTLPPGSVRLDTLALPEPTLAAVQVLGASAYRSIDVAPATPPDAEVVGEKLSATFKECLTKSDNQFAEQLLLMAASKEGALPRGKEYQVAAARLQKFLTEEAGCDPGDFVAQDGSGLSRHNLVTARGLVKLMTWAKAQPWSNVWLEGLAAPGEGTLKGRLAGSNFRGKTGTLNMVSCLSGYVTLPDGRTAIMSLLVNHFLASAPEIRALQDEFVKKIESVSPSGTLFDGTPHREVPYLPLALARRPNGHWVH